jgi:hypothetical protein
MVGLTFAFLNQKAKKKRYAPSHSSKKNGISKIWFLIFKNEYKGPACKALALLGARGVRIGSPYFLKKNLQGLAWSKFK